MTDLEQRAREFAQAHLEASLAAVLAFARSERRRVWEEAAIVAESGHMVDTSAEARFGKSLAAALRRKAQEEHSEPPTDNKVTKP